MNTIPVPVGEKREIGILQYEFDNLEKLFQNKKISILKCTGSLLITDSAFCILSEKIEFRPQISFQSLQTFFCLKR